MVIYVISSYTATIYLFISSAGEHLTKFSPIFASFQPPHPSVYAYACSYAPLINNSITFEIAVNLSDHSNATKKIHDTYTSTSDLSWLTD